MNGTIDQKKIDYVESVVKSIQEGGGTISATERTVGGLYVNSQNALSTLTNERARLTQQMEGMRAQLTQLTTAIDTELGKARGFAEALIEMRFTATSNQKPTAPAPVETAPTVVKKRKRRTKEEITRARELEVKAPTPVVPAEEIPQV